LAQDCSKLASQGGPHQSWLKLAHQPASQMHLPLAGWHWEFGGQGGPFEFVHESLRSLAHDGKGVVVVVGTHWFPTLQWPALQTQNPVACWQWELAGHGGPLEFVHLSGKPGSHTVLVVVVVVVVAGANSGHG